MNTASDFRELPEGVLPDDWIRKAVASGIIDAGEYALPETSFQPASLDLRLGKVAYRLRSSFLPGSRKVQEQLQDYSMGQLDLRDGAILERNRPYLIPLVERVRLPQGIRGRANPRSSVGRLDIFTRVITDRGRRFDEIPEGYDGPLFLEVASQSFTISVRQGLSLNQLRLIKGQARLDDADVAQLHQNDPLLYLDRKPVSELLLAEGLFLSVDLRGEEGSVGFKAKKNSLLLDLSKIGAYHPDDYWEPIKADRKDRLILEPEEFYLLISLEKVRVPPQFAVEMSAYDPTGGELRTHYAGFFDPGFGYDAERLLCGTKAVMEVRAHDVPFALEHGQSVAKLVFERMSAAPTRLYGSGIGSSYQDQRLTLSKHFVSVPPSGVKQAPLL